MTNRRSQGRVNVPFCAALVLFWLVAVTTYLTGGLYARYVTSGAGADSARVAKFGSLTLTETGSFGNGETIGMIIPGVALQKDAQVHFDACEMATVVFMEAEVSGHWTYSETLKTFTTENNHLSWTVAEDWTFLTKSEQAADGTVTYVFYTIPTINTALELDFIADEGKIAVSDELTEGTITALDGSFIRLRAGVIQSGGFASVAEAWDALKTK